MNINDKLDRLQSSLDPWAHIQQEQEAAAAATAPTVDGDDTTTTTESTTTKLSLFKIRTLPTTTTTTTTTFRPRSLADLFKHRAGQKVEYPADERPPATTTSRTTTQRIINTTRGRGQTRPRSRLSKFRPSTTTVATTSLDPRLPDKPPVELFIPGGRAPPPVLRSSTTGKPTNTKEIFRSIPVDRVPNVLPPDYQARAPTTARPKPSSTPTPPSTPQTTTTTSIIQEDVSGFLPPGYRLSTTSTSTESTLVADIFSSISIEDIDDSLLPKEFKDKHKSTNGFKPSGKSRVRPPRPNRPTPPPNTSERASSRPDNKKKNTVADVSILCGTDNPN